MARLKNKDMQKLSNKERTEKINELKVDLLKAKVKNRSGGKSNIRILKKTIARLMTFNNLNKLGEKQEAKKSK